VRNPDPNHSGASTFLHVVCSLALLALVTCCQSSNGEPAQVEPLAGDARAAGDVIFSQQPLFRGRDVLRLQEEPDGATDEVLSLLGSVITQATRIYGWQYAANGGQTPFNDAATAQQAFQSVAADIRANFDFQYVVANITGDPDETAGIIAFDISLAGTTPYQRQTHSGVGVTLYAIRSNETQPWQRDAWPLVTAASNAGSVSIPRFTLRATPTANPAPAPSATPTPQPGTPPPSGAAPTSPPAADGCSAVGSGDENLVFLLIVLCGLACALRSYPRRF
jgi:hypothetical protein